MRGTLNVRRSIFQNTNVSLVYFQNIRGVRYSLFGAYFDGFVHIWTKDIENKKNNHSNFNMHILVGRRRSVYPAQVMHLVRIMAFWCFTGIFCKLWLLIEWAPCSTLPVLFSVLDELCHEFPELRPPSDKEMIELKRELTFLYDGSLEEHDEVWCFASFTSINRQPSIGREFTHNN